MRNLQEQVKKAFCYQKLFWTFTAWISFANSTPSASNFKSFSRSLEQLFLTVGQNNFGNKIPFPKFAESLIVNSSNWLIHKHIHRVNETANCKIGTSKLEYWSWISNFYFWSSLIFQVWTLQFAARWPDVVLQDLWNK